MKRILLILPPLVHEVRAANPPFMAETRGHTPPLGLLYIAAYLRKHSLFPVELIDACAEGLGYDEVFKARIMGDGEDDLIVGIPATTFTMIDAMAAMDLLCEIERERGVRIQIVLGGPHPSIYARETAALPCVDYVVVGEGEISFFELCSKLMFDEEPRGVKGVV